jgi:hypothetical protein
MSDTTRRGYIVKREKGGGIVWYGMYYTPHPTPPTSSRILRELQSRLRLLQLLLLHPALFTHNLARANQRRHRVKRRIIVVRGRRMRVS